MTEVIEVISGTSEAYDRLQAQLKATELGALPIGDHAATLVEVKTVRRKRDKAWMLRLIARIDANERYVMQWRPLAKDGRDPFVLGKDQQRRWRQFLRSMRVAVDGSVAEQFERLEALVHTPVTATIKKSAVGVSTSFSVPSEVVIANDEAKLTNDGEIVMRDRPAEAHELHEMLVRGLNAARLALSAAAEACYRLSREQAWVNLGYEKLKDYLASPEISISRTEFFDLANIWERYVLDGGADPQRLQAGGPSKLAVPLPALERGDVTVDEALGDVESLGLRDLREKYRGGDESDPQVKDDEPPTEGLCPHCGLGPDASDALVYAGQTWPAWVTAEMARAAVESTEGR